MLILTPSTLKKLHDCGTALYIMQKLGIKEIPLDKALIRVYLQQRKHGGPVGLVGSGYNTEYAFYWLWRGGVPRAPLSHEDVRDILNRLPIPRAKEALTWMVESFGRK